jgi:hypothetical protein
MSESKVSIQHPEYIHMAPQWKKCRDAAKGQRAVHEAGTEYLPRLSEQDNDEYNAYKLRAQFFNATWRTIQALSGMLFRKPPEVEVPAACEPLLEDITMDGRNFTTFSQQVALEVEEVDRVGLLIDLSPESTEGLSQAEAERRNLRPSMNYYPTESIINWRRERINNKMEITLVVLVEESSISNNEFEHEAERRYRVLDLIKVDEAMVYRVRVYRVKDGNDEQIGDDLFPMMEGKNLPRIPFYFISTYDTTPKVREPSIIDLVDTNFAHYRLDADLKHGLHFTGLPQPVITGYTPREEGEKLCIGSTSAWVFPAPEADAKYLEFTGQGLSGISNEKEKTAEQMAILGARMLAVEKKDSETAQTATIHRAGENSILESASVNISIGLTQAMTLFCAWSGSPDSTVSVALNKDFVPTYMDPQELKEWTVALISGSISEQEYFWTLQRREAVPPGMTFEEHQEQINNSSRV